MLLDSITDATREGKSMLGIRNNDCALSDESRKADCITDRQSHGYHLLCSRRHRSRAIQTMYNIQRKGTKTFNSVGFRKEKAFL